jgi:hypothetical protein
MPTVYDIARQLKLPAVEVQAHIHPQNLTSRMRNATKRFILNGHKGGWSSKANRIAEIIRGNHDLSWVALGYYTHFYVKREFTPDERALLIEIFEADNALYKMSKSSIDDNNDRAWALKHADRELQSNLELANVFIVNGRTYFKINSAHFQKEVGKILMGTRSDEEIELTKQLASKLDGDTPIPLKLNI